MEVKPTYFAGIDPGIHSLSFCVIEGETEEIVYASGVDLAPDKNANKVQMVPVCDRAIALVTGRPQQTHVAQFLAQCPDHGGIAQEIQMKRRYAILAETIRTALFPKVVMVGKSTYSPESSGYGHDGNKIMAERIAGDKMNAFLRASRGPAPDKLDELHHVCEAYLMAVWAARKYLKKPTTITGKKRKR